MSKTFSLKSVSFLFSEEISCEGNCFLVTARTDQSCIYNNHEKIVCLCNCTKVSISLSLFLVGGHGGIPDSDRWRPEGAGH